MLRFSYRFHTIFLFFKNVFNPWVQRVLVINVRINLQFRSVLRTRLQVRIVFFFLSNYPVRWKIYYLPYLSNPERRRPLVKIYFRRNATKTIPVNRRIKQPPHAGAGAVGGGFLSA